MADSAMRILLVDGQTRLRRLISHMLSDSGHQIVHQASDGAAAGHILRNTPVDVILCNWNSENFDAGELLRSVRSSQMTKFLPFLLLSGGGRMDLADYAAGKDFDADGFISMPITQDELHKSVRFALQRHQTLGKEITHLSRAGAFIDVKRFDEARSELDRLKESECAHPRIWNETGMLYEELEAAEIAKSCYQKAISIDRDYARPFDGLGSLLWKAGDLQMAGQLYEHAAAISPRNSDRQFSLARLSLEKGDIAAAQEAVARAVERKSSDGAKRAAAAEFYLSAGHFDLAEKEFDEAVKRSPRNLHFYNQLGMALRRQKKWGEAARVYQKALRISPRNPIILYNMARSLAEEGKEDEARRRLHSALVIDPAFHEAEKFLSRLTAGSLRVAS